MRRKPLNKKLKKDGNRNTYMVSIKSIMTAPEFGMGYNDAKQGKPYCTQYERWRPGLQEAYERGRMFAYIGHGPIKEQTPGRGNKKIVYNQYVACCMAFTTKSIL